LLKKPLQTLARRLENDKIHYFFSAIIGEMPPTFGIKIHAF
jgi:hypothetical protein